ncbi:hypothetical protein ZIOFF_061069 [Zingiber officinale]|uniref:Uncharacterized protein n=1 Tax=Zingiber officinale TaxID=94328 RepID=A0A8J5FBI9_ZINOF|nr:hypothetical protein ZIOFF_061069 [Zingiber officinale]
MAIGPKISSRCPIPDSPTTSSSIPSKEDSASEQQGKLLANRRPSLGRTNLWFAILLECDQISMSVATKSADAKGRNSNGGISKSIWAAILNLLAQKEETLMEAFQHLEGDCGVGVPKVAPTE